MKDPRQFRLYVRRLRRKFPLSYPVRVGLCPSSKLKKLNPEADHGVCEIFGDHSKGPWSGKRPLCFRIWVLDSMSEEQTIQVLVHEWAHALRAHIFLHGDLSLDDPIRALIEDEIWRGWHA